MDYKEQAHKLELRFKYDRMGLLQLDSDLSKDCLDAAKSITELLIRAEAAEARCKELEAKCKRLDEARERANEAAAKWESAYKLELERVEKAEHERDAVVILCGKLIALCSPPKEWEPKLFRRHINRPGDYMGCGYDFLDGFNRICYDFTETADDDIYAAIREVTEKEILKWEQRTMLKGSENQ